LERRSPGADRPLRALWDAAIAAVARYPRTASGKDNAEAAWDEVLTAIDEILIIQQKAHMADVRAAGASGKDVPPAEE
jgi:hypothetical protein